MSAQALQQIITESRVLEADLNGPKVLESADGQIIYKLFRRKRWFSSALLWPYAVRFVRNARRLQSLGFSTIEVRQVYRCRELGYHLLTYDKLPGQSVRDLLRESAQVALFARLGRFIAQLHAGGVYFRSLHLGNLLVAPQGSLALIDIADMRFFRRPLSASQRLRNFQPLLNRVDDHGLITPESWQLLVEAYATAAGIDEELAGLIRELGKQLRGTDTAGY